MQLSKNTTGNRDFWHHVSEPEVFSYRLRFVFFLNNSLFVGAEKVKPAYTKTRAVYM